VLRWHWSSLAFEYFGILHFAFGHLVFGIWHVAQSDPTLPWMRMDGEEQSKREEKRRGEERRDGWDKQTCKPVITDSNTKHRDNHFF